MPPRRSRNPIKFAVTGDEGELVFPNEIFDVEIELNDLLTDLDVGAMNETRFRKRVRELVLLYPWFIEGHLELAYALIEDGDHEKALTHARRAFQAGKQVIPKDFSGTIPWSIRPNRSLLEAATCLAHCHTLLLEHNEAIKIMQTQLAWNPDDDQDVRFLIGSELFRENKFSEAQALFEEHAENYPPYYYELGLLHFLRDDFVASATNLRRGFATNPYIAEMLCGSVQPLPMMIWHTFEYGTPNTAADYVRDYGVQWFNAEYCLSFVHWLFNHSKVMMERARLQAIREEMLWEGPGSTRAGLAVDESDAFQRIDDTLSEAIIQTRTDEYGNSGYPWKFPFRSESYS